MKLTEINYVGDLVALGIPVESITSPYYGYDGVFDPQFIMPHHTASARTSGDNWWVLEEKHYQFLVGRSSTVGVGGFKVRQGHAGNGNVGKVNLGRNGQLTPSNWAKPGGNDDTGSYGNTYGMGTCIDIDGVGEVASDAQWNSFVTLIALMCYRTGKRPGHVLHHQGYTNRKIDVKDGRRSNDQFWNDITNKIPQVERILGGGVPAAVDTMLNHPKQQGYWIVAPTGQVKAFGVPKYGDLVSQGVKLERPISGACVHPNGTGYWLCSEDGGVFCFGSCGFYGTVRDALKGGLPAFPITQIASTPDGKGYWLLGEDGGIFSFGNASYYGNWFD